MGGWSCKRTVTGGRRPLAVGARAPRPSTEFVSQLNADGSFVFSGGMTLTAHPSSNPGQGQVTRGKWKTEDAILYSQLDGATAWTPLGRYQLDGSGRNMTLHAGGEAQLWERIR